MHYIIEREYEGDDGLPILTLTIFTRVSADLMVILPLERCIII